LTTGGPPEDTRGAEPPKEPAAPAPATGQGSFLRLKRQPARGGSRPRVVPTEEGAPAPPAASSTGADRPEAQQAGRRSAYVPETQTEVIYGHKSGSRYARLARSAQRTFQPGETAHTIVATPVADAPRTFSEGLWRGFKKLVIGAPIASSRLDEERLSKVKALAIFASDALSSTAYATEEILLVLVLAGSAALTLSIPISIAIAALLIIVSTSYRQTIRAYPQGGGAYKVALENLGTAPGLIAGASLVVDYTLTVAVSTAAGVAAITSAIPELHDERVPIAVVCVLLLTVGNLRGVRESGSIFALPTYFFLGTFTLMIGVGFVRLVLGDIAPAPHDGSIAVGTSSLGLFLLLRAFSSGATALTGIEAISNGVPAFKAPEPKNAAATLTWMAAILTTLFISLTILAHQIEVYPSETKTVVAQIADAVFAGGPLFYVVQGATALILVLAANTSFAGLPALASVMARDRYVPHIFAFRGDRLGYSNGIMVLAVLSIVLLIVFGADTHRLIPLYAVGVFVGFTLSQFGMVVHWRKSDEPGRQRAMIINFIGGTASGVVAVIIATTKFTHGAWISMLAITLLAILFARIGSYYRRVHRELALDLETTRAPRAATAFDQPILLAVDDVNRATIRAVSYALSISSNVTAIHITGEGQDAADLRAAWASLLLDVPLTVIETEYRTLSGPVMAYVDSLDRANPGGVITVMLPEYIARRPWQRMLHNQSAQRMRKALTNRPNTVVIEVPYQLS
jgi:amino acid transporter